MNEMVKMDSLWCLEVLEKCWNVRTDPAHCGSGQASESMTSRVVYIGLDGAQVSFLEQSHAQLKQSVYDGLVLQTRLADFGEAANEAAWERAA